MPKGEHLYKHGFGFNSGHGGRNKIYISWVNMRQRCNNPRNPDYKYYGGRGIKYCRRWGSFSNFYQDMSPTYKDGMTIDRIKVNQNYSPSNCRWASRWEQSNNRNYNRILRYGGKSQPVSYWAKELGVTNNNIHSRLSNGWTVERTLTQPYRKSPSH